MSTDTVTRPARTRRSLSRAPHPSRLSPANNRQQALVRAIAPTGVDAEFLTDLGRTTQLRQTVHGRIWAAVRARSTKIRRLAMVLVLLSGLGIFAAVGTADRADAIPFINDWCAGWRVEQSKDNAREGIVSYGETREPDGTVPDTTWANYGLAGINWDVFWVECSSFGTWIMGGISDMLFSLPMILTGLIITFFQWTFEGHIINVFVGSRSGAEPALDTIVSALQGQLFLQFFGLMTVIAALVLLWRGIIKGSGLADVLGKIVIVILVGAFGMYFGANAASTVKYFNDRTNDIMGITFAAFAQATCEVTPGTDPGECGSNGDESSADATDVACVDSRLDAEGTPQTVYVSSVACIGQVMYHALIFLPWATGEIGPLVPAENKDNKPIEQQEFEKSYQDRISLAMKILRWQAYARSEIDALETGNATADPQTGMITPAAGGPNSGEGKYTGSLTGERMKGDNWPCYINHPKEVAFDLMMKDFAGGDGMKKEAKTLYNDKYGKEDHDDDIDERIEETEESRFLWNMCELAHPVRKDANGWKIFTLDLEGAAGFDEAATDWDTIYKLVANDKKDEFDVFAGRAMMHRFQTAVLALIAGMAMAVIILAVAIAYLILQIATVAFAMLAPLAALIGLIPVFGLKIFLKWGELFLGTFLKRLGLGVFVGFLMTLYTMVLSMPFQWYMQLATLIGIALVGLVYRKKLLELAGLGGVNDGMKMAGGLAAKGAWGAGKGGFKFGRNRVDGARMRMARYKGAMDASKDQLDENGRKVGKGRRRLTAFVGAARKGKPGRLAMELDHARHLGGQHASKRGAKKGYVADTDARQRKSDSKSIREQAINDVRARRQAGEKVRIRRTHSGAFKRSAERGEVGRHGTREITVVNSRGERVTKRVIDQVEYKTKTRITRRAVRNTERQQGGSGSRRRVRRRDENYRDL